MDKVWVVEQGEYSDYRVVGVFSSEQNAKLIADRIGEDAKVACWPLDPAINEINQGMQVYLVWMLRNGNVTRVKRVELGSHTINPGKPTLWKIPGELRGYIWATDETHAIKIMNEHRTQMIASGEWRE